MIPTNNQVCDFIALSDVYCSAPAFKTSRKCNYLKLHITLLYKIAADLFFFFLKIKVFLKSIIVPEHLIKTSHIISTTKN
jgi:hypothetical protein